MLGRGFLSVSDSKSITIVIEIELALVTAISFSNKNFSEVSLVLFSENRPVVQNFKMRIIEKLFDCYKGITQTSSPRIPTIDTAI